MKPSKAEARRKHSIRRKHKLVIHGLVIIAISLSIIIEASLHITDVLFLALSIIVEKDGLE